jgi:hypothetical protein
VCFLAVAFHTVPSITSVPDPGLVPPSPEEVEVLMELSDWLVGEPGGSPLDGSAERPLSDAIRNRSRSFELFRSFNDERHEIDLLHRMPFGRMISETAERHRLDGLLVAAVIEAESAFDPTALSPAGAVGLMQVLPSTAEELGVTDPLQPAANLEAGSRYLKRLLRSFDGDLELALAAYNAGPGNVLRYGGVPPFPETRRYVDRVLETYVDHHREIWSRSDTVAWLNLELPADLSHSPR